MGYPADENELAEALNRAQDEVCDLKAAVAKESAHVLRLDGRVEALMEERDKLEDDKNSLERELEMVRDKYESKSEETASDLEWCLHKMIDLGFDPTDIWVRLDHEGVQVLSKVMDTKAMPPKERIAGWAYDHFLSVCERLKLDPKEIR